LPGNDQTKDSLKLITECDGTIDAITTAGAGSGTPDGTQNDARQDADESNDEDDSTEGDSGLGGDDKTRTTENEYEDADIVDPLNEDENLYDSAENIAPQDTDGKPTEVQGDVAEGDYDISGEFEAGDGKKPVLTYNTFESVRKMSCVAEGVDGGDTDDYDHINGHPDPKVSTSRIETYSRFVFPTTIFPNSSTDGKVEEQENEVDDEMYNKIQLNGKPTRPILQHPDYNRVIINSGKVELSNSESPLANVKRHKFKDSKKIHKRISSSCDSSTPDTSRLNINNDEDEYSFCEISDDESIVDRSADIALEGNSTQNNKTVGAGSKSTNTDTENTMTDTADPEYEDCNNHEEETNEETERLYEDVSEDVSEDSDSDSSSVDSLDKGQDSGVQESLNNSETRDKELSQENNVSTVNNKAKRRRQRRQEDYEEFELIFPATTKHS